MGERRPTRGTNLRVRMPIAPLRRRPIEIELGRWISNGRTPDVKALAKALDQIRRRDHEVE
jgi:hypothetical protein